MKRALTLLGFLLLATLWLGWRVEAGVRRLDATEMAGVAVGDDWKHFYECNFAAGQKCNSTCFPYLDGFATCELDFAIGICDLRNEQKDCVSFQGDCGWLLLCEDRGCCYCQIYPYQCDLVTSCKTVP